MGLDSVEMVIEVEDRFGIRIPDAEAEKIVTVGDLYQVVLSLIASSSGLKCKTQHVFYRLRKSLPFHLREGLKPETELDRILPKENIQATYSSLQKQIGLQLPSLVTPAWYSYMVIFTVITLIGLCFYGAFQDLLIVFVGSVMLLAFSIRLFDRLHGEFATELSGSNVRDLVVSIVAKNYHNVLPPYHNENEILDVLKVTVVDTLGVDLSDVTLDARFSQDLGMD